MSGCATSTYTANVPTGKYRSDSTDETIVIDRAKSMFFITRHGLHKQTHCLVELKMDHSIKFTGSSNSELFIFEIAPKHWRLKGNTIIREGDAYSPEKHFIRL